MITEAFRLLKIISSCIPNHENGSWYGYDGWSKNFHKLMSEHPVYIDPVDAFSCRWMFSMIWFEEKSPEKGVALESRSALQSDYLKPEQKLYSIVSGIGSDAHFGGDYQLGLSKRLGRLAEKLAFYRKKHPEHAEFYDAEELVIRGIQNWISRAIAEGERMAEVERHPVLKENLQMAQVNRNILNGALNHARSLPVGMLVHPGQPNLQQRRRGIPIG